MNLTAGSVLKNLKNQYSKPSTISDLGKHISNSLQQEFKLNKTFYLNLNDNTALFNLVKDSLKTQIIKQEFALEYNAKYNAEYERLLNEYSSHPVFELQAAHPADVEQAKLNYFRTLYNRINSRILNYINLNEQENREVNKQELTEISELMHLKGKVNVDAEFVQDIVKKIEEKEFMRNLPQSASLVLAKDISKLYNFNLAEELAKVKATQIAEEDLQKGFDSASALIKRRVDRKLEDCKEILKESNTPRTRLNDELIGDNRFGGIVNRITEISNDIFNNYKITLYHNAFGYIKNSVFNDEKLMSENTFELSDQIKPLNITLMLEEYAHQFSKMFDNNNQIINLEAEILTNKELTEEAVLQKQQEIKWYQTNSEMLYNFVEIVERQKAIKNVLGDVNAEILSFNEIKYTNNRVAAAFEVLKKELPNASPEFINTIGKNAFTNYAKRGTVKASVTFDEFIKLIELSVESSRAQLQLSEDVNMNEHALAVAGIVKLTVENNEELGTGYTSEYETTINRAKLLVNIKRYSEFAKTANELTILKSSFEHEYEKLGDKEAYFSPKQLELLNENDLALKFELESVTENINGVLKRYANNEAELTEFVVSFVNELKNEVLSEPNPKIRQNLLNAYAEPLINNDIIASNEELVRAVEVLAKREDRNYQKINEALETFEDAINVKEIIKVNLVDSLNKKFVEKENAKEQKETEEVVASPVNKEEQETKTESVEEQKSDNVVSKNEEQPIKEEKVAEPQNQNQEKQETAEKTNNEATSQTEQINEEVTSQILELEKDLKETEQTIEQHFEDIKSVNLSSINQDAHTYMKNEIIRQKLANFNELSSQEKVDVLNAANIKNSELGVNTSLNYASFKNNEQLLKSEAEKASDLLELANKNIINKYSETTDHEKVAFVVLSLTKNEEMVKQEVKLSEEEIVKEPTKPARTYNLSDKKEYNTAKNDMFWKMQLNSIQNKGVVEESLNDQTMEEFNAIAPVVKLFEIAASDNLALSEVTLQNIGQLNYQQLARVSILKYKEGQIEDQQTVDLVNHIISNTTAYSKTAEYNKVVDNFLAREDIVKELSAGTKSLEELIDLDVQNNGELKEVVDAFNLKTSPTIAKVEEELAEQGEGLEQNDSTIVI